MSGAPWIWRNFRLALPDDWDLLQFTRRPVQGRCAWADRYGFRLEFIWRAVPGPPDFDRMMGDYAAKLEAEGARRLRRERREHWHGIVAEQGGRPISRFGAYFDRESCIVELVFPWAAERAPAIERAVLASVREEPPDATGRRRWRAFGMDLRTDGRLDLLECRVAPGRSELRFGDERGRRVARFQRLGLRPFWMRVGVAEWLREQTRGWRDCRESAHRRGDHQVFRREGETPTGILEGRLRGRKRAGWEAWICPADDRLYARHWRGPSDFAEDEGRHGALGCAGCGGLGP